MKRNAAKATKTTSTTIKLAIVFVSGPPANDTIDLLATCEAELIALHKRTFRGSKARFTVRYTCTVVEESRVLAYTGRRVEVWTTEIETVVGYSEERFYLPV
jgi:hypothetical protein